MQNSDTIICKNCKSRTAILHWDTRYDGYRGTCMKCGGDWPES